MRLRPFLFGAASIAMSVGATLAAAELVLRFLPYNQGLWAQAVNEASPVFRFHPQRSATRSEGWDFAIVNRVRVNNDGFVNDQDYDRAAATPLLAVVGDSYIEAGIVSFADTVHGRLAALARGRGRVYSFAASGAGLSQYLVWAAYARDAYKPDALVVNVIANDLAESLYHVSRSPGFHHFERQADGGARLRRVDYEPGFARHALRRSALVMYLLTNVKVQRAFSLSVRRFGRLDERFTAQVPFASTNDELADYRWVVDRFLEGLPEATGLSPERILLVLDGFRPDMYELDLLAQVERSTWGRVRAYLSQRAAARGIETIDLHPAFLESYRRDGQRLEIATDAHWNARAHGIVARHVADWKTFATLFAAQ